MRKHRLIRAIGGCLLLAVSGLVGTAGAADITTHYEYDDAGQVTRQYTETAGQIISDKRMDYDAQGRAYRTRELADPASGTLDNAKDRISKTIWDADGRVVVERRKYVTAGTSYASTTYQYDVFGRPEGMVDAEGNLTTSTPDGRGNPVVVTDAAGNKVEYAYDAAGNQTVEKRYEGADTLVLQIDRTYDSRGNKILEVQYDAQTSLPITQQRWSFDAVGRLASRVQMADPARGSNYTPSKATDRITEYAYDCDTKRPLTVETWAGSSAALRRTLFHYDDLGRVDLSTDPNGNTQALTYVPVDTTGEGQVQVRMTTNPGLQDPTGVDISVQRFEYTYDWQGRVKTETAKGGGGAQDLLTQYTYDDANRIKQVVNPRDIRTLYYSNAFGDQVRVFEDIDAKGRTTDMHYDQLGRLDSQTASDGDGHTETTTYAYDLMDRRTGITFPDSGSYIYHYDLAGRMDTRTDPRGQVTTYTSNWRSQTLTKTVNGTLKESFTYYPTGWMQAAWVDAATEEAATNKSHFTCDAFGQVTSVTQTVDGVAKTIASQFFQSGDRSQLTYPSDLNQTLTFAYDALAQVTRIDRNGQPLAAYTYAGRSLTQRDITTSSTPATHVTYNVGLDAHRRQVQLTNRTVTGTTSTVLDQADYEYDPDGNRATAQVSAGDKRLGVYTQYGYDTLDRLQMADYGGNQVESFDYDLLGNRCAYTDRQGRSSTYTHNDVNQYTTIAPAPQAPAYDAAGNLLESENGYLLYYDHENRLTMVKDAAYHIIAAYTYDALGHRVAFAKSGLRTRYYYDGETVLAEYDSSNSFLRCHIQGPTYVDEHILLNQGGQDYYYLLTTLYSVSGLVDANGAVVERYRYDAYGQPTWLTYGDFNGDGKIDLKDFLIFQAGFSGSQPCGEAAKLCDANGDGVVDLVDYRLFSAARTIPSQPISPFRFTGQRLDFQLADPATGRPTLVLYHYRARAYDAYHGRFLQRDPAEYEDGMNLYEYVSSRPLAASDPTGKFSFMDLGGSIALSMDLEGNNLNVSVGLVGAVRGLVGLVNTRNEMLSSLAGVASTPYDTSGIDLALAAWEGYQKVQTVVFAAGAITAGAHFAVKGVGYLLEKRGGSGGLFFGSSGGHHLYPKWAGGAKEQWMAKLGWGRGSLHDELERTIKGRMKDKFSDKFTIGGPGGRYADIRRAFDREPGLEGQVLDELGNIYRDFDRMHNTSTWEGFMLNIALGFID